MHRAATPHSTRLTAQVQGRRLLRCGWKTATCKQRMNAVHDLHLHLIDLNVTWDLEFASARPAPSCQRTHGRRVDAADSVVVRPVTPLCAGKTRGRGCQMTSSTVFQHRLTRAAAGSAVVLVACHVVAVGRDEEDLVAKSQVLAADRQSRVVAFVAVATERAADRSGSLVPEARADVAGVSEAAPTCRMAVHLVGCHGDQAAAFRQGALHHDPEV